MKMNHSSKPTALFLGIGLAMAVLLPFNLLGQQQCKPKTDPLPFEGGKNEDPIIFSYYSDADKNKTKGLNYCYERVIENKSAKNQLWVNWRDSFGVIMDITIPPSSRNSVYQKNLEGEPLKLPGRIEYGLWKDVTKGPPLNTYTWRSPEEAPPPEKHVQVYPTIVAGFRILPMFESSRIPIHVEVQSDYMPDRRQLVYRISNFAESVPLRLEGARSAKGLEKYPVLQWQAAALKDFKFKLPEKDIIAVGSKVEIFIDGVEQVQVGPGPVVIQITDRAIFQGTVSVYFPVSRR